MKQRIALIVGVDDYQDEIFNKLRGAIRDAQRIAGFLEYKLPDESRFEVNFLSNPTAFEVERALDAVLPRLEANSTFFFYFAGHGIRCGQSTSQLLLCSDATRRTAEGIGLTGGIMPEILADFSRKGAGDMAFCYDVCRSTALARGTSDAGGSSGFRDVVASPNSSSSRAVLGRRWTLSSCEDGQLAGDDGAFVTSLLEEMDAGLISGAGIVLDDCFVARTTTRLNRRSNATRQTPTSSGLSVILTAPQIKKPPKSVVAPPPLARPPLVSSAKSNVWFRIENGAQIKTTEAELLLAIADGTLKRTTLLWTAGQNDWEPAGSLAPFRGCFQPEPLRQSTTSSSPPPILGISAGKRKRLIIGDFAYGFCWIPPGSFTMGSPKSEWNAARIFWKNNDEPERQVTLTRGFWILETPVTQRLWAAVANSNPSSKRGLELPVDNLCWNDCREFIQRMNKNQYAASWKFRLPTEAEWEYACRAGSSTTFAGSGFIGEMAWFRENSGGSAHCVKMKKCNAWNLYDMHGNVWEWCEDRYDAKFYLNGDAIDPVNVAPGNSRVLRGGNWGSLPGYCRSAFRNCNDSCNRCVGYSFRLVLESPRP